MRTKLFDRLSYLLCLFQISCFVALQRIPLYSSSFSGCSDAHKKIVCNIHSEKLQIEPKNFGNELLVYGFIRELEPKVANKIIPNCIMSFCLDFSRRMLPCDCIKEKYRKILLQLDMDENRKKALIFFLMYKIEDVQDEKDKSKKTILHCACGNGNLELAKLLRKWGANIHAKDEYGANALHLACLFSGSVPMVTWLLDVCKMSLETKGYGQKMPFLCAAEKGQLEIAKLLKERGASINAEDKFGNNALHYACACSGSVPMVTWLLDECKMDIEIRGKSQMTPFLYTVQGGQLEIAKRLKERSANINAKEEGGNNALHYACGISGSIPMVTWLLDECKMGLENKGHARQTPFFCAAKKGHLSIAKLLRQRGAKVNARDKDGYSALHAACSYSDSVAMVTWLLDVCKYKIDIKIKGKNKRTPFLCAARSGHLKIAKLLKQRGANIHAKDKYGNNALHLARIFRKNEELIHYLESESFKTGRRLNFWSKWF